MRFRKRPVVIEAHRLDAVNGPELADWCGGDYDSVTGAILVPTREGTMRADQDDWIIKGIKGEFYPCKPDIFWMTYERAE